MVAYYTTLLDKKFQDYPTPITTGVVLTIKDYHQDFRCSLDVKHRKKSLKGWCYLAILLPHTLQTLLLHQHQRLMPHRKPRMDILRRKMTTSSWWSWHANLVLLVQIEESRKRRCKILRRDCE